MGFLEDFMKMFGEEEKVEAKKADGKKKVLKKAAPKKATTELASDDEKMLEKMARGGR